MTPLNELGDFDHTLHLPSSKWEIGQTIHGKFHEDGGEWFGQVMFACKEDAMIEVVSHTKPSDFRKGQKIRVVFQKKARV